MSRAGKLRKHGVRKAGMVVREASRAGLSLADAVTMLEQETGIPQHNIFGCDYGEGKAFCHKRVTAHRVRKLLRSSLSNGIGWTQVTYKPLIPDELRSKIHKPKYQCRVGFAVLANNIRSYGVQEGHARYNGSGPAAEEYGRRAVELRRKWQNIIG